MQFMKAKTFPDRFWSKELHEAVESKACQGPEEALPEELTAMESEGFPPGMRENHPDTELGKRCKSESKREAIMHP